MKKINYILIVVFVCAMGLVSCTKHEDFSGDTMKSAEIELSLTKADFLKSGSLTYITDDSEDYVYCDDVFEATSGSVTIDYTIQLFNANGSITNAEENTHEFDYTTAESTTTEGISELLKIDFPSNATYAEIVVTSALINAEYEGEDGEKKEVSKTFLAPKAESAFADYVDHPVGEVYKVDLYEKTYMKVDVLCFNEQAVALFGYTWLDFEIITGKEVCMFFNCKGSDAKSYHQIFGADFVAQYYLDNKSGWVDYWEGKNYGYDADDDSAEDIMPICIPCPGTWANEENGGFRLLVTPMTSTEVIEIMVSKEQIEAFLDGESFTEAQGEDGIYSLILDSAVEGEKTTYFLHYTMEHCYKPEAWLGAINGEITNIYGISFGEDSEPTAKLFISTEELLNNTGTTDYSGQFAAHFAMTPDESTLLVGPMQDASLLFAVDVYSKDVIKLEPDATVLGNRRYQMYAFTQMVYIDDKLYAGCQKNNCLVEVNTFINKGTGKGTFGFGADIIQYMDPETMSLNESITGGDLVASAAEGSSLFPNIYSLSQYKGGSIIRYTTPVTESGPMTISMYAVPTLDSDETSPLAKVNGGCLLEDVTGGAQAMTSHKKSGDSFMYYRLWKAGIASTLTVLKDENNNEVISTAGGDMASANYVESAPRYGAVEGAFFSATSINWTDVEINPGN